MTAIMPKTEITSDSRFWTIDEVAEHYRTSVATLRYWRYTGYGPKGTKVGRNILYPQTEIERFDQEVSERVAAESRTSRHVPE